MIRGTALLLALIVACTWNMFVCKCYLGNKLSFILLRDHSRGAPHNICDLGVRPGCRTRFQNATWRIDFATASQLRGHGRLAMPGCPQTRPQDQAWLSSVRRLPASSGCELAQFLHRCHISTRKLSPTTFAGVPPLPEIFSSARGVLGRVFAGRAQVAAASCCPEHETVSSSLRPLCPPSCPKTMTLLGMNLPQEPRDAAVYQFLTDGFHRAWLPWLRCRHKDTSCPAVWLPKSMRHTYTAHHLCCQWFFFDPGSANCPRLSQSRAFVFPTWKQLGP